MGYGVSQGRRGGEGMKKRRTDSWASNDCHGISRHGDTSFGRREQVSQYTTGVGHRGRSKEGTKEASDHQSLIVFRSRTTKGEAYGKEHGHEDGHSSSENLTQRRPQKRTNTETDQEDGGTQDGYLMANVELFRHQCSTGRVAGGSPAGTHGDQAVKQRGEHLLLHGPVHGPVGVVGAIEVDDDILPSRGVCQRVGELVPGGRTGSQAREDGVTTGNSLGEVESASGVGVLRSFLGAGSHASVGASAGQSDVSAGDAVAVVVVGIFVAVLFGIVFIVAAGTGVHMGIGVATRHRRMLSFRVVEMVQVLRPVGVEAFVLFLGRRPCEWWLWWFMHLLLLGCSSINRFGVRRRHGDSCWREP